MHGFASENCLRPQTVAANGRLSGCSLDFDPMFYLTAIPSRYQRLIQVARRRKKCRVALGFPTATVFAGLVLVALVARAQSIGPVPAQPAPSASNVAKAPLKVASVDPASGAQETGAESESRCAADQPQGPLMRCMSEEIRAVDRQIERMLESSIASLPDAEVSDKERVQARNSLLAAQDAWKQYRESSCNAALLYLDNGGAGKLEYLDCMRRLAERRLHDFTVFLQR